MPDAGTDRLPTRIGTAGDGRARAHRQSYGLRVRSTACLVRLEDCDRRLHPIYWARPDADARRPARELMEYTAALKARIENDLAGGVIELPSEGAPSPRP